MHERIREHVVLKQRVLLALHLVSIGWLRWIILFQILEQQLVLGRVDSLRISL